MLAIRATMEILPADPRARKLVGISESFNDAGRWALFIHASSE